MEKNLKTSAFQGLNVMSMQFGRFGIYEQYEEELTLSGDIVIGL